jgi:hypothetical protein
MQNALTWGLVIAGYIAPGVIFGLALRPAAELMKRGGAATARVR